MWELDQNLIGRNRGLTSRVQPGVLEGNLPPSLTVDGAGARSVTLPGSVQLAVLVADDMVLTTPVDVTVTVSRATSTRRP